MKLLNYKGVNIYVSDKGIFNCRVKKNYFKETTLERLKHRIDSIVEAKEYYIQEAYLLKKEYLVPQGTSYLNKNGMYVSRLSVLPSDIETTKEFKQIKEFEVKIETLQGLIKALQVEESTYKSKAYDLITVLKKRYEEA